MTDKMAEIFLDEANDLLDKLEDLLLELENNPEDIETIQAVFRIMHTIKGSSGMFGFDAISRFTHEVESARRAGQPGQRKRIKRLDRSLQALRSAEQQDAPKRRRGCAESAGTGQACRQQAKRRRNLAYQFCAGR